MLKKLFKEIYLILTGPTTLIRVNLGVIVMKGYSILPICIHLTDLSSEFSFSYISCHSKVKEPSLSFYLLIAGGKIVGCIPFPSLLALCEMQTAWSRIWTWVTMFISNDDNYYTKGTFTLPISPEQEPHHQTQFSVILRRPLLEGSYLSLCRRCCYYILSVSDRVANGCE